MREYTKAAILTGVVGILLLCAWTVVPKATSVTCTNAAGVVRAWTTTSGGVDVGAGSASASTQSARQVSPADKSRPQQSESLADVQRTFVGDPIADGIDPVTAARLFGPATVPGATGAQRAHAMDPETYGWYHCH